MTPKEKAERLFQLFLPFVQSSEYIEEIKYKCKQCALIAVDEIISIDVLIDEDTWVSKTSYLEFWKEVKQEIEKI